MFVEEIRKSLLGVLGVLGPAFAKASAGKDIDIALEHPADLEHGDYSTNVALKLQLSSRAIRQLAESRGIPPNTERSDSSMRPNVSSGLSRNDKRLNPKEIAGLIVKKWQEIGLPEFVEKVEVAGPGFLNIWLKFDALGSQLTKVLNEKEKYGSSDLLKGKKILLEHTSPNPQTTIMLGHLRNNFLGMAVANILSFSGAKVTLDDVVNDRGVHLCRSMLGYLIFCQKEGGLSKEDLLKFREVGDETITKLSENADWKILLGKWTKEPSDWWTPEELGLKSDHANLTWYVLGSRAYKSIEKIAEQVHEILREWEAENQEVRKLWKMILNWSELGYAQTYKRIGSRHDQIWHESEYWQQGKDIVEEGLKKGIFKKSEGAIVTDLEKNGLPDNVVVKTDGTALYMTQDLAVTTLKKEKFPSDYYIWDIGAEQTLYFRQLFAVIESLGIIEKEKLFHLSYALINFKGGGKMATRKGDVIMADEILDELHSRALEIIKSSKQELREKAGEEELNNVAEKTALAAIKYSMLKYGRETTMFFDPDESLAMQGNSGPYIQYGYARTQSVLAKVKGTGNREQSHNNVGAQRDAPVVGISNEEQILLRTIYRFPEIVAEAGREYSPNLICNFIYDIAQKFNLFYDKERIIGSENEEFRLVLTEAVGQVLKNGLSLLGIEALEKM